VIELRPEIEGRFGIYFLLELLLGLHELCFFEADNEFRFELSPSFTELIFELEFSDFNLIFLLRPEITFIDLSNVKSL